MSMLFDIDNRISRSAEISECGRYRWWLRRSWQLPWNPREAGPPKSKGTCCFVMLNPSTADALQDDPTIRRCIAFARGWGYDTLSVRNLFPWRATDPKELLNGWENIDMTGGSRGASELLAACTANLTIVAWGAGVPRRRDRDVLLMFGDQFPGVKLYCLGTTKHGHPRHPLYVRGDTKPIRFDPYPIICGP